MVYTGKVKGGVVLMDKTASLAEGTVVAYRIWYIRRLSSPVRLGALLQACDRHGHGGVVQSTRRPALSNPNDRRLTGFRCTYKLNSYNQPRSRGWFIVVDALVGRIFRG